MLPCLKTNVYKFSYPVDELSKTNAILTNFKLIADFFYSSGSNNSNNKKGLGALAVPSNTLDVCILITTMTASNFENYLIL
jgi:hypothetical protein